MRSFGAAPVFRTEENTAVTADIDYVGILNLLRQLVEKGSITKAESRKIAGYLAQKTGWILLLFLP